MKLLYIKKVIHRNIFNIFLLIICAKKKFFTIYFFLSLCYNSSIMSQTYNPNNRKRAKTHGFLTRKKTVGGKRVLLARLRKGRKQLAV